MIFETASYAFETESISSGTQILIVIRIMSKIQWILSNVIVCHAAKFRQNRFISF